MKEVIISLKDVSKSYKKNKVIDKFSYDFTNGLYILYGASGSGKTTLLNMIAGAISFEFGSISIYDKTYNNQVSDRNENIAYITQNNYFIDYLTIYDNLLLCSYDKSKIETYLNEFKLSNKKNNYPHELSGGEQQRIAIIEALLQNKKIILLDEPTSSIDSENRNILIDILNKIKRDTLIICASHDEVLKSTADYVIDFKNLDSVIINDKKKIKKNYYKYKKRNLLPFMLKEKKYKKREKKSSIYLILVLIVILLLLGASFDYKLKIEKGLMDSYDIKFVKYFCYDLDNYCKDINDEYGASYVLFPYSSNVSLGNIIGDGQRVPVDYNVTAKTLPFSKKLFKEYKDVLAYGDYFKDEFDVILGYDVAKKLSSDVGSLIGTKYYIKLSDKDYELNIVGILGKDVSSVYLKALYEMSDIDDYVYLNSEFTKKYMNDGILGYNELESNRAYMISYFDNVEDMYKFYNTNNKLIEPEKLDKGFLEFTRMTEALQYYLYPVIIFSFIVVAVFYFQMQKIISRYNSHLITTYHYYGYSWKNIYVSYLLTNIISIIIKFIISFIISLIIMIIFNSLHLLMFDLFLIDIKSSIILLISLIILSIVFSSINILSIKKMGWINVIKGGDDLL